MQRFERQRHVGEDAPVKGQRAGFLRSEDGSLIVFGLFVFLLMAVVAGMAVDFMRFETQRTRLQSTLDRAILAASSLDQTADPEYIVMDYFNKAGLGSFIDASQINVLNQVGSLIYELSDGQHSVADIASQLAARFDVSYAQAESDTLEFLHGLETQSIMILETR